MVGGVKVTGARHIALEQGCQDAVAWSRTPAFVALAVADGHGHARHARSADGAEMACQVALTLLQELALDMQERPGSPRAWERELQFHLARRLSWAWNQAARAHAGHEDPDGAHHPDLDLYGTTVLACLRLDSVVVLLQLGDGDILLVDADGVRCAFPPNEELYGTTTFSLAQVDAWSRAQLMVVDARSIELILLATDGLRDSFGRDPQDFLQLGPWFRGRVQDEGLDALLEALPDWLSEVSRRGAGDDTTVGLIWAPTGD